MLFRGVSKTSVDHHMKNDARFPQHILYGLA